MSARRDRQRIWFERWIREGYSLRQLVGQSGYSTSTLRRLIDYWLARPPAPCRDLQRFKHLVIDGTYIQARRLSVVGIADTQLRCLVVGFYQVKEGERRMVALCEQLRHAGLDPLSVTIDGLKPVLTMIETVWPQAIVQRCLVHIQRQGLAWCRRDPHTAAVKHLRKLFTELPYITTTAHRDRFLASWQQWERRFGQPIAERPGRGKIFSDVKRARSLLWHALPHMFHYLDTPAIARSTNWIESYFSRLKPRYRQHRGLSKTRRAAYFAWYFHLCQR
jgi:transposase-like protein